MTKPRTVLGYGTPDSKKRPQLNGVLAILTALCLIGGCMLFCVTPFAFDAPGSDQNPAVWRFVYWCWSIPIISVAALRLAKQFEKKGEHKKAQITWLVPIIAVLVFLTVYGFWQEVWHGLDLRRNLKFIFS